MCAKNHLLIFRSFLDIWENVEWPRFFWTTRYRGGQKHSLQCDVLQRSTDVSVLTFLHMYQIQGAQRTLSTTFYVPLSRTFHDHLCSFLTSFHDCLIGRISNKSDFLIHLLNQLLCVSCYIMRLTCFNVFKVTHYCKYTEYIVMVTTLQTLWNSLTFPWQCAGLMPMLSGTHSMPVL